MVMKSVLNNDPAVQQGDGASDSRSTQLLREVVLWKRMFVRRVSETSGKSFILYKNGLKASPFRTP